MDLRGKTIVVTGAAQGLGQKMAETVASRGANVALVDVDHIKLKETVQLCSKTGGKVKDYAADVTDEPAVVALFDNAQKDFGSIDGVINNAGITSTRGRGTSDLVADRRRPLPDTHPFGVLRDGWRYLDSVFIGASPPFLRKLGLDIGKWHR
jgi:NAD(P)-dependent dehydrogenase (short-subunit alcohol dehydrogenase family)